MTSRRQHGFTMLELIMAMAVFTILGAAAVLLMRQGLSIFAAATKDAALQDRMEGVLPQVEADLNLIALPASFDPPPPPPSEEERLEGEEYVPPPPVVERLRATSFVLRDLPEALKGLPAYYIGLTIDATGDRSDAILRRAGERAAPGMKPIVPEEEESDLLDTTYFLPTGGLREIVYIAVPGDPETYGDPDVVQYPGLLTLYYGWRSPVGGPNSLLDVGNLDSIAEIRKACRPVAEGLIHFGVLWRRVFSHDWEPTTGRVGETDGYVGGVWDSTRALDKEFALYRSGESLGDPSDDVFPAWARLEIALVAPSTFGFGRGETLLAEAIGTDERFLRVEDVAPLLGPGPDERYLKVDGEWMRFSSGKVQPREGRVPVERGLRGTKAASHNAGTDIYVGLSSSRDVRLLFRDRYARKTRKPR